MTEIVDGSVGCGFAECSGECHQRDTHRLHVSGYQSQLGESKSCSDHVQVGE